MNQSVKGEKSESRAIIAGLVLAVGMICSGPFTPAVEIWPILFTADSVNHNAPSGPLTIPNGTLLAVAVAKSLIVMLPESLLPLVVSTAWPIFPAVFSVNQTLLSKP